MPLSEIHNQFCKSYISSGSIHEAAKSPGICLTTIIPKRFYVYFLIEEQSGRIFYVGKGSGIRVLRHFQNYEASNPYKQKEMLAIVKAGNTVSYRILESGLQEAEAFTIERQLIKTLYSSGLTNMRKGQHSPLQKARKQAEVLLFSIMPFETWMNIKKRTRRQIKDYHLRIKELSELAYS
jgi:hypothetical protein